jgi:hypothetical protein
MFLVRARKCALCAFAITLLVCPPVRFIARYCAQCLYTHVKLTPARRARLRRCVQLAVPSDTLPFRACSQRTCAVLPSASSVPCLVLTLSPMHSLPGLARSRARARARFCVLGCTRVYPRARSRTRPASSFRTVGLPKRPACMHGTAHDDPRSPPLVLFYVLRSTSPAVNDLAPTLLSTLRGCALSDVLLSLDRPMRARAHTRMALNACSVDTFAAPRTYASVRGRMCCAVGAPSGPRWSCLAPPALPCTCRSSIRLDGSRQTDTGCLRRADTRRRPRDTDSLASTITPLPPFPSAPAPAPPAAARSSLALPSVFTNLPRVAAPGAAVSDAGMRPGDRARCLNRAAKHVRPHFARPFAHHAAAAAAAAWAGMRAAAQAVGRGRWRPGATVRTEIQAKVWTVGRVRRCTRRWCSKFVYAIQYVHPSNCEKVRVSRARLRSISMLQCVETQGQ